MTFLEGISPFVSETVETLTPPWISASLIVGILIGLLNRKKNRVAAVAAAASLSAYLMLILGYAVALRVRQPAPTLILTPFRTYAAWISGAEPNLFFEDFVNVVMTIPIGICVPIIVRRRRLLAALCTTVILELLIETAQYVFVRGVTEIDDLINGVFGALIGFGLYAAVAAIIRRFTIKNDPKESETHV